MTVRPSHTLVSLSTFPQLPHLEVSDKHYFDATSPMEHSGGPGRPHTWRKLLTARKQAWVHSFCWSSGLLIWAFPDSSMRENFNISSELSGFYFGMVLCGQSLLTCAPPNVGWGYGVGYPAPFPLCLSAWRCRELDHHTSPPRRQALLWGWGSAWAGGVGLSPSVEERAEGQHKRGLCSWG